MSCDCGEGCCPSSNPLWIKELSIITGGYEMDPLEKEVRDKVNEIIEKHNILADNNRSDIIVTNQIFERLRELEKFKNDVIKSEQEKLYD